MLTTQQAAEIAGVSRRRVRQWITTGELRARRLSPRGAYLIRPSDLDRVERRPVGRPPLDSKNE